MDQAGRRILRKEFPDSKWFLGTQPLRNMKSALYEAYSNALSPCNKRLQEIGHLEKDAILSFDKKCQQAIS